MFDRTLHKSMRPSLPCQKLVRKTLLLGLLLVFGCADDIQYRVNTTDDLNPSEQSESPTVDSQGQALLEGNVAADPLLPTGTPVFHQTMNGVSSSEYSKTFYAFRDRNYVPTAISGVRADQGTIFNGIMTIDPNIRGFDLRRGMSMNAYYQRWRDNKEAGLRLADLDVHVVGHTPYVNALWLKEHNQLGYKSKVNMTRGVLESRIETYRNQGYRPQRINGWSSHGASRFSGVWVQDQGKDWVVDLDLTSAQFSDCYQSMATAGYHPIDVAAYEDGGTRFSGIWVMDEDIVGHAIFRNMTGDELLSYQMEFKHRNLVQVDQDAYIIDGNVRYSAIWHLREPRDRLTTSIGTNANLESLEEDLRAFDGRIGFVIEDLTNGSYVAFNPHESFYAASTNKVQIAAAVLSHFETGMLNRDRQFQKGADFYMGRIDSMSDEQTGAHLTLGQYLDEMINFSSNTATDLMEHIMGMTALAELYDIGNPEVFDAPWLSFLPFREIGRTAINATIRERFDLHHLEEITGICERNKRKLEMVDECFRSIPCGTLQRWYRDQEDIADEGFGACTSQWTALSSTDKSEYRDLFFHDQNNSITPTENAKFWRKLVHESPLDAERTTELVDILDNTGNGYPTRAAFEQNLISRLGHKYGNVPTSRSWVGLTWNNMGGQRIADFSVSIYTKGFSSNDASREIIDQAVAGAMSALLQAR